MHHLICRFKMSVVVLIAGHYAFPAAAEPANVVDQLAKDKLAWVNDPKIVQVIANAAKIGVDVPLSNDSSPCPWAPDALVISEQGWARCAGQVTLPDVVQSEIATMREQRFDTSEFSAVRITDFRVFAKDIPFYAMHMSELMNVAHSFNLDTSNAEKIEIAIRDPETHTYSLVDGVTIDGEYKPDSAITQYIRDHLVGKAYLQITFAPDLIPVTPELAYWYKQSVFLGEQIFYVKQEGWGYLPTQGLTKTTD